MASNKATFKHIIHHLSGVAVVNPGDEKMMVSCTLGMVDVVTDLAQRYGYATNFGTNTVTIYF